MSQITVILDQGQSVEVHTEEGSFVVSHGKKKLTVRCAEETGPDKLGRMKTLYEKDINANDAETRTHRGQSADDNNQRMQNQARPQGQMPHNPATAAATPPTSPPQQRQ